MLDGAVIESPCRSGERRPMRFGYAQRTIKAAQLYQRVLLPCARLHDTNPDEGDYQCTPEQPGNDAEIPHHRKGENCREDEADGCFVVGPENIRRDYTDE